MCIRDRLNSVAIQTVTGIPVKVLEKVDVVRVRLGLLEFSHQILVADIVDEVILGTDIMLSLIHISSTLTYIF